MTQICYVWNEADFTWENNDYTWDDVCFALELLGGHADYDHWEPAKQQRFIGLYLKVKQQLEPETFYAVRPLNEVAKISPKNIKITADDVKLVIENVLKVNIEI